MGSLYARAFGSQALLDAWAQVRDAALADGQPDSQVAVFEVHAAEGLADLGARLADGSWAPAPVYPVEIPKPSGGVRMLGVPPLVDRVVERALLRVLDPIVDARLLPWSFAFRRGLGTRDALAALAEARDRGSVWVARGDIRDCFARIPQWEVLRVLREVTDDQRVLHLVALLLDRPAVGRRAGAGERGLGLHQGSPLSPLLCNLYLDRFDRAMLAAGHRVLRYGDDLAIPADSRADAEKALITAGTELTDLRLELNAGKSQVVSFDEGVPFLGETTTASTLHRGEMLSHPLETSVYVDRQGAVVRVRGDRLVVTAPATDTDDDQRSDDRGAGQQVGAAAADKPGDGDASRPGERPAQEALLRLSLRRVRQVVCYGRVSLTTPFLHRAAERGIEVVLLTESGGMGARLASPLTSDPQVRRAQYRAADDEARSLVAARAFVAGKLTNMRVAILRAAASDDDADAYVASETIAELAERVPDAPTIDEALGLEGAGSRAYFQELVRTAAPVWEFTSRQRRPPPDPINAMLSYGYTLLANEAAAAAETAGLDPMVGLMHRHRWGRPALALDLMEEFRPLTVDVAIRRLLATDQLRPEQFDHDPATGCRMSPDARTVFLAAYERRMLTLTTHQPTGRRVSYRVALSLQAKAFARSLLDPAAEYQAHVRR